MKITLAKLEHQGSIVKECLKEHPELTSGYLISVWSNRGRILSEYNFKKVEFCHGSYYIYCKDLATLNLFILIHSDYTDFIEAIYKID